jgi:Trk K+ transport system NAD-binding subunit
MSTSLKRLLIVLLSMPVLLLAATFLYMLGSSGLEDAPRDFWQSLQWAAETLTTTGYGADARWNHPLMILFVIAMQFLGVLLIFLVVPLALVPFLERRFETKLPRVVAPLEDHLVIYRYGPAVETILEEATKAGIESLILEHDAGMARQLIEAGHRVLTGRQVDDLVERSFLDDSRGLIANGTDDENAAVIVGVRQSGYQGEVLALVEEPVHRRPMMLAGATAVFTPRHVLGAALAARASDQIGPSVSGLQQLGWRVTTLDVKIQPSSPLAGRTLGEVGFGRETGATVLGQWIGGQLDASPSAATVMAPGGILIVAGSEESIARVETLCEGSMPRDRGPFVVGGFGEVGAKVVQLLRDAGEEVRVIDQLPRPGVDVVGDVKDVEILETLDLPRSKGVILALDTDTATLFAAVIVKDLAPGVPIIARVNQAENLDKIHRAGADFALSLSQVSGQILGRRLLGEEAIAIDSQLKLVRVTSQGLAGRRPWDSDMRRRTGCSVVAVERDDDVLTDFDDDFRFEADDALYVCGSNTAVRRFKEMFAEA